MVKKNPPDKEYLVGRRRPPGTPVTSPGKAEIRGDGQGWQGHFQLLGARRATKGQGSGERPHKVNGQKRHRGAQADE